LQREFWIVEKIADASADFLYEGGETAETQHTKLTADRRLFNKI